MGELIAIREIVRRGGFAADRIAFDFSIVRGLEYYTGAVFEAQLIGGDGANYGSVGGGGRYDDLVAAFAAKRFRRPVFPSACRDSQRLCRQLMARAWMRTRRWSCW
ncbi:MAG: ATP phosphoribosyltransferase regulatory subunit [Terricaulis sp.]